MRNAEDTRWQDRARCVGDASREVDPYFPEGDAFSDIPPAAEIQAELVEQAKAVCAQCPVSADCLAYSLVHGIPDGIWGGMGPIERVELLELAVASGE